MRINHNLSALNAWKNMTVNDGGQTKSLEKLSSGLRIGRAADDAAGLSISEKMRGQISGLNQASRNAQDGISLLQTAEGALQETHSILQRMRELAVQAASDTVTDDDRVEIQKEINALRVEIDRISTDTEFNTQKLLNGEFENKIIHIGANTSQNLTVTVGAMGASDLKVNGMTAAKLATKLENIEFAAEYAGTATLEVNGEYTGTADITAMTVEVTDNGEVKVTGTRQGGNLEVTLDTTTNTEEVDGLTFTLTNSSDVKLKTEISGGVTEVSSSDILDASSGAWTLENAGSASLTLTGEATNSFSNISATVVEDGKVQITYQLGASTDIVTKVLEDGNLTVTEEGLTFELTNPEDIRANSTKFTWDSTLSIEAAVDPEDIPGEGIDVSTQDAANSAITTINDAINTVSGERSKLGAIQNRLEHTIANLATSVENLTAAESRIRDVDIAVEMMNFTKYQILSQASTAMLAQANAKPQAVLQLLR